MNSAFTPVVLVHSVAALAAVVLGAGMFLARKGSYSHRVAGRGWVALMLLVSISSFWIQTKGHFTWIHILSVAVPLLLAAGVAFAVAGNVRGHQKTMVSLYVGSLGIAGAFTLLPHRLLGKMLWSSLGLI
jgi:uncharacterized membrane protein